MTDQEKIDELLMKLKAMETITCYGPAMSMACKYEGPTDTFLPNLIGIHNACRCPKCGSTNNNYNTLHSKLVSLQMKS